MKIKLAGIIEESIVDGPGIRFVIFTQGCPHHCLGCHNPETHDINKGYDEEISVILEKIKNHPFMTGITISGGEPFIQVKEILDLIKSFKIVYPKKNIMIYSGFTYEQLLKQEKDEVNQILKIADFLVDGRYDKELRDISLRFRGSSNQRIIDLKKSSIDNIVLAQI